MSQESSKPTDPRADPARERTDMASFRTALALDRTTLAWVRTTLSMAGFGFGMVAFFRALQQQARTAESARLHAGAIRFGTGLVVLAILATVLAAISHWFTLARIRRGDSPVLRHWPLSITVAMLFAALGLVALWSLLE
jgi:putative membrane protein